MRTGESITCSIHQIHHNAQLFWPWAIDWKITVKQNLWKVLKSGSGWVCKRKALLGTANDTFCICKPLFSWVHMFISGPTVNNFINNFRRIWVVPARLYCLWMSTVLYAAYAIYIPAIDSCLRQYAVHCCRRLQKHFSSVISVFYYYSLTTFSVCLGFFPCTKSSLNGQLTEHVFVS